MEIKSLELLASRNVNIEDMIELVHLLQDKYYPNLTDEEIIVALKSVLSKTEIYNALITGIELDKLAEKKQLANPDLQLKMEQDNGLYGIDEVVAFGMCNLYGSIALTNYGYLDKAKPGIVEKLNDKNNGINVFLDDMVAAIAACAASKVAHNKKENN